MIHFLVFFPFSSSFCILVLPELYIAAIAAGVSVPLVVIAAAITGSSVVFIWKMKGMYSNSLHTYIYNATRISNGKYQHNKVR